MENKNFHFTYGLITGIIVVIIAVIFHITNVPPRSSLQYILYLPFATGVIMACMNYGKANNHLVTFGKVFTVGFKTTALITIIVLVWVIISFFVFPEMKEQAMEMAMTEIEEQDMPDDQAETGMAFFEKFYYPTMIGGAIFGNMIPGLIFSLIGAVITKKEKPRQ